MSVALVELVLYGRASCHLCEDMKAELMEFRKELDFALVEVEVEWEGELAKRYGQLLPVLVKDGVEICHYFLDPERFRAAFR